MNKVVKLFRECRFSELDGMVRNGSGSSVVEAIETFDQCKFIARHASGNIRLMECMSYTARSIADNVEKYIFASKHSQSLKDKKEMLNGLKGCNINPLDLVAILNSSETEIYNFGLQKINEVNYSFEDWKSICKGCVGSAQLAVSERMFVIATSYEEKMWVFDRMSLGWQEKVLPQIAEFLW